MHFAHALLLGALLVLTAWPVDALKARFFGLPGRNRKHTMSTVYHRKGMATPIICFDKMIDMNELTADGSHKWIIQLDGHLMRKKTAADMNFLPLELAMSKNLVQISPQIEKKSEEGSPGVTYFSEDDKFYFRRWYRLFFAKNIKPYETKSREKRGISGTITSIKAHCWAAPVDLSQWQLSEGNYWWVVYKRQYLLNTRFRFLSFRWFGKKYKSKKFKITQGTTEEIAAQEQATQQLYAELAKHKQEQRPVTSSNPGSVILPENFGNQLDYNYARPEDDDDSVEMVLANRPNHPPLV